MEHFAIGGDKTESTFTLLAAGTSLIALIVMLFFLQVISMLFKEH
jgi:hypothetical protein